MVKKTGLIFISLLLAFVLLLGLTACAGKGGRTDSPGQDPAAIATEEVTTEPEDSSQTTPEQPEPQTAEPETTPTEIDEPDAAGSVTVEEDGWYYDKEHVAAYIHQFGKLPGNYMTKAEARKLGWSGGSLERFEEGRAIGGDSFGNREGALPKKSGRKYYECDIDTNGRSERGTKRIIYSNDGLIYYTEDHYKNFTLLYGEE